MKQKVIKSILILMGLLVSGPSPSPKAVLTSSVSSAGSIGINNTADLMNF